MWKQWSLLVLGLVVVFAPLIGVPFGAKRTVFLIIGAAITIIAALILRESHGVFSKSREMKSDASPEL